MTTGDGTTSASGGSVGQRATVLAKMRAVDRPREHFALRLRTVGSAGERLGADAFEWGREALGLAVNEFYGQTECNYVLGASATLGVLKPGAIGKAVPGHTVAVIDAEGRALPPGAEGEIAIRPGCRTSPST